MDGCLKGALKLGCAVVLLGALALAWWFRAPIMGTVAHWFGGSTALPPVADTAVGAPTPSATASGQKKVGNLRTNAGPDSVVLNPNEMASLIGGGMDWQVRKTYDSLRVELPEDKLILHARLDTRALPPGALGHFAGLFGEHEPPRIAGTVTTGRPGTAYDGCRAVQAPEAGGRGGREPMSPRRVMIVDDEKGIREALKQVLEYEEIEVQASASGHEAIRAYPDFKPHLVFLDVKMEGMDGLETLKRIREVDPQAQVVMISGHGTIQTAVEATQLGAYDFLEKPLDTDRILLTLRNALQHVVLVNENVRLKKEFRAQYEIVGSSKAIRSVIEMIEKVAPTPARVLITGENGTGKELVARAIHALNPRASGPFIEVNCAAIPSELIESELFR